MKTNGTKQPFCDLEYYQVEGQCAEAFSTVDDLPLERKMSAMWWRGMWASIALNVVLLAVIWWLA